MKMFEVSISKLKFGDRLIPLCYYYSDFIKENNIKKGIKYVKLGDISKISDGEHSAIPRNNIEGIRYLYGRNIKEGVIDFDPISDDSYISKEDYDNFKRCHICQNDVLIEILGTVGKSAIYKEEYVGIAGIPRHISNISLYDDAPITPEYLTAFLRSKFGKWQMNSVMTGNIQQLLSLKNLREFDIPVPEKKIIDYITSKEKEALNYEIEALDLLKKAQLVFYDGLNFDLSLVESNTFFSINATELDTTNSWSPSLYNVKYVNTAEAIKKYNNAKSLKEITNIINGDEVGSESYEEFIDKSNDSIPFIRTSDIVNNETDLYPDYFVASDVMLNLAQDIRHKDVLFTKDGKIASVGMVTDSDNVIVSSGIARIRLNEDGMSNGLTQEYLFTALNTPEIGQYAAARRTVVASTIPHLRIERLKEIEIPIESKEYVDRITDLVNRAFTLKGKRKLVLKNTENYLDDYFQK